MATGERVDAALIEELLYGSEGVDLDFKRDQYPFDGQPDVVKAELLKDILAFANSFRRNDAYILIGVNEVDGGRAEVVGVADHLKDANLQEFVNTKTNRNVTFSYHVVEVEGKHVGVIRIEDQQRPVFLKKDFAFDAAKSKFKLPMDTVYHRVGSSTKVATPDEIIRMSASPVRQPVYDVDFQFANFQKKVAIGTCLKTTHRFVAFDYKKIPDFVSPSAQGFGSLTIASGQIHDNKNFWREAYNRLVWFAFQQVGFYLHNRGDATIDDVTVEMSFPMSEGFSVQTQADAPKSPRRQRSIFPTAAPNFFHEIGREPDLDVEKRGDHHVVTLRFGKVQVGQKVILPEALFLGCTGERRLVVDAVVRADQFPSPLISKLMFEAEGYIENPSWESLKETIETLFSRKRREEDEDD